MTDSFNEGYKKGYEEGCGELWTGEMIKSRLEAKCSMCGTVKVVQLDFDTDKYYCEKHIHNTNTQT